MAGGDLAGGKRTAADLGAWLVFEDESGQGLRPPKGRTWGRRGQTPVVRVTGGSNKRVSLAALIAVRPGQPAPADLPRAPGRRAGETSARASPRRTTPGCWTPRTSSSAGPLVLVWDNLNTHVSRAMAELVAARDWLTVFRLPPYATS